MRRGQLFRKGGGLGGVGREARTTARSLDRDTGAAGRGRAHPLGRWRRVQQLGGVLMRFAYADPPYLGCAVRLYGDHPDAAVYDTLEGHQELIWRLSDEFPD